MPPSLPLFPRHLPRLEHLRSFVSIAHAGSMTEAAELLNMTQPGLSIHLSKLEDYLGTRLFNRAGGRLELTPQGEVVLARSETVLAEIAAVVSEAANGFAAGRWLRVGMAGYLSELLGDRIVEFAGEVPGLRISILSRGEDEILDFVSRRRLDLGLVGAPVRTGDLHARHLGHLEIVLVSGDETGPARLSGAEDLAALQFMGHPSQETITQAWLTHHFPGEPDLGNRIECHAFVDTFALALRLAVKRGLAGFLPKALAQHHDLHLIEGPDRSVARLAVTALTASGQGLDPAIGCLVDMLVPAFLPATAGHAESGQASL